MLTSPYFTCSEHVRTFFYTIIPASFLRSEYLAGLILTGKHTMLPSVGEMNSSHLHGEWIVSPRWENRF